MEFRNRISRSTSALAAVVLLSTAPFALAAGSIDRLSNQISQAVSSGRNADGLAAATKLESLVRRQQGTDNTNYAGVLHNQGMFLHNLGRYQEAEAKLSAALSIKLRKADAESVMRTSNILTESLVMLGRGPDAQVVAERALATGAQAFGGDDPRLAGTLSSLGTLARENEDYKKAETFYERSLANYQKVSPPDPLDVAEAMDALGDLYGLEGRFDDGERLLQQSLRILEQAFAGRRLPSGYSKALNDLGNLYKDAGRLPDAEAAFARGLVEVRAASGEQHPNTASTMGNLSSVLYDMTRYVEAEDYANRSLQIYDKLYGPTNLLTAIALGNLANIYNEQGRTSEAMGLQQRVLAIREKLLGPDAPDVARALGNLANSYKDLGRTDEAGALYERVLHIMTQKFGEDGLLTATALSAFARSIQDTNGRADEALRYYERALAIHERVLGPEHPDVVDNLRSIAFLDIKANRLPEARQRLQRALAVAQVKWGPRHRTTLATMVNLAEVAGKQNNWPEALSLLRRASDGNAARNASAVKSAIGPADRFSDLDNALINASWQVSGGKPDKGAIDEAFRAAQRAYETQAGGALAQAAVRFGAGNDAIAKAVRRQQDQRASLVALEQRITTELGAPDGKRNDGLIAGLRTELDRSQKSYDDASAQISRDFPSYAELSSPAPLSVAQTQTLLKPDEVLVSFISNREQSFVFAITRDQSTWQKIPLNAATIAERVSKIRESLFSADPNAPPAPFDLGVVHGLYVDLLGPVEGITAGKPKLLIVPTGALTSLPFQVLTTKPVDASVPPLERARKASWLVNEKAIAILPAVTSLRALRSFARASRATKPFIGFGDPLFQKGVAGPRSTTRNVAPYQSYYNGSLVDYEALRRSLPALPDTADELRAVASALGAGEGDLRLGASASVTTVMAASLQNYRVIDFATHGLVAGQVDGLSEPALVLSLPDKPTADDDGLLTAGRIARLNLDADWAVLSACNTAAGDRPGAEGLSGLARAFFYAGARSLLVSHWPVESDAAVKLTTGAFAEITRNPSIGRAEALRRSMRALIIDPSSARNSDPSVWAPFVLVGEGS